jgi:DNA-binding transcriptional regulator YiaG
MAGVPKVLQQRKKKKSKAELEAYKLKRKEDAAIAKAAREKLAAMPYAMRFMTPTICRMGRGALGLSVQELAQELDIDRASIAKYERGGLPTGKADGGVWPFSAMRDFNAVKINQFFRDKGLTVFFSSDGITGSCGLSLVWDFLTLEDNNPRDVEPAD